MYADTWRASVAPYVSKWISGEEGEEFGFEVGEGYESYAAVYYLTILEVEHGRDAADAVFGYDLIVLVDVEFTYHCFVSVFLSKFLNDRTEFHARSAPCGPKIDYYYFS